ncbi:24710_t:CDS:1 [Cetraspora pellucida]|uniref:SWI5-dependent HO expression protein 3 n=1 Tax=Cetraspora pellucida TaxID=1433469 RepID=A0A9N8WH60_9GLOM|nr:24710_t:CDS:1 [Cetraspora pellucida]
MNTDPIKVTTLKHQVHTLRHDLAEKNALLATVQKKLNRHRHQITNGGGMTHESTTGKVIGNLHHEIEYLKKEVADAKTQIHVAKVARDRADRQVQEHSASHQTLRLEIDSLKRMLERKERQVKELEEISKDHERKRMDLKSERDNTNIKLQESEQKASNLEHQLALALLSKEQAELQYQLLTKEMKNFKQRYVEDVELIKKEFQELREEMNSTAKELEDVVVEAGAKIEEITLQRQVEVEELQSIQAKLRENQEKSFSRIQSEVEMVKKDVEISNQKTKVHTDKITYIQKELSGKMSWLRSI